MERKTSSTWRDWQNERNLEIKWQVSAHTYSVDEKYAYLHKIFHSLPELMSESKRWDTYIIYTHTYMYMHSYIHLYVEIRYLCIFVATFPLPLFRFTISAYFSFRYCVSLLTCCWVKQTLAPHKLTVLLAPLISIAVARTKIHIYAHTQCCMRDRNYTSVCQAKKF